MVLKYTDMSENDFVDEFIDAQQERQLPEPNPVTKKSHQKEILRQVTLPFVIALLGLAALVSALIFYNIGTLGDWARISTIFLIFPLLVFGIIVVVIMGGLAYLINQVLRIIPPYTRLTQQAIDKVNQQVKTGTEISVKPVMQIQSFLAMIDSLLENFNIRPGAK